MESCVLPGEEQVDGLREGGGSSQSQSPTHKEPLLSLCLPIISGGEGPQMTSRRLRTLRVEKDLGFLPLIRLLK